MGAPIPQWSLVAAVLALAICYVAALVTGPVEPMGFYIETADLGKAVKTHPSGSTLHEVTSTAYKLPLYVLKLKGDNHREAGLAYGQLMGEEMAGCAETFWGYLSGQVKNPSALKDFLIWQWHSYLSIQTPDKYIEEMKGMAEGTGGKVTYDQIALYTTLANFPGDQEANIIYLLAEEFVDSKLIEEIIHLIFGKGSRESQELLTTHSPESARQVALDHFLSGTLSHLPGILCSDLSAWGDRVPADTPVYFGRNLDWISSSGLSDYKTLVVYEVAGEIPHATSGFALLPGGLAGFNKAGISFGEAGLDVTEETFKGFPWILRARELLATSHNLSDALAFWHSTNNTVGMNYLITSTSDRSGVALETMKDHTQVFHDADPNRWAGDEICESLTDAVYRTNHACGRDAWHAMNVLPTANSGTGKRWIRIVETLKQSAARGPMSTVQWLNATAIPAMHGHSGWTCDNSDMSGSSVLSLATDLGGGAVWVAYEEGRKAEGDWVNAVCGTYLQLNTAALFGK